jgi:hypothetical protein
MTPAWLAFAFLVVIPEGDLRLYLQSPHPPKTAGQA